LYPAVLTGQGIVAALGSYAQRHPSVTVQGDLAGRYDAIVEATAYFCCVDAMRACATAAPGAPITVTVETARNAAIRAVVTCEAATIAGTGSVDDLVQGLRDRVGAAGGGLAIAMADGATQLVLILPTMAASEAPVLDDGAAEHVADVLADQQ